MTRSRVSVRGSERPSMGTRGVRAEATGPDRGSGVRLAASVRVSEREPRDTASVLSRQALRQIAHDGVPRPELLLHVSQLPTRFLEEEAASDEVEEREQIQKHDDERAEDDPQILGRDEALVGCQELQRP